MWAAGRMRRELSAANSVSDVRTRLMACMGSWRAWVSGPGLGIRVRGSRRGEGARLGDVGAGRAPADASCLDGAIRILEDAGVHGAVEQPPAAVGADEVGLLT